MTSRAPMLNVSCTKSLFHLEETLLQQFSSVESWFNQEWQKTLPPIYGSVDLRNAGFKIAPVDMNLFPAGFNNLNPEFLHLAVAAARAIIREIHPATNTILVIPESHTRNLRYWDNIKTLQNILTEAGFTVRFGSIAPEMNAPQTFQLPGGQLDLEPVIREGQTLHLKDFYPDVILLNNDLSEGIPTILQNLTQIILPPAELGWYRRLKSTHFQHYANITESFAQHFSFDPWLITPLFKHCGEVDFMQQAGMQCVINNAEALFTKIEKKYAEYHITNAPFIIVKADSGTYGMAVMTVRNIEELKTLNRKQRTKMASIKGGKQVERVIIQEGVHTFETIAIGHENAVAEPVIYLWGKQVVGGFYRVHKSRGVDENLNSPGMQFEPIAFRQTCHEPLSNTDPFVCQNQYYIYGVVAKLSMLAAARELKELGQTS